MTLFRVPGPLGRETVWKRDQEEPTNTREMLQRKQGRSLRRIVPPILPAVVLVPPPSPTSTKKRDNSPPVEDGDVRVFHFLDIPREKIEQYVDSVEKARADMDESRRAIFINGINNTGHENMESACILSFVLMAPVISLFNKSDGVKADLRQCLNDKRKFQTEKNPKAAFEALAKNAKTEADRMKIMEDALRTGKYGNPATAAAFKLLTSGLGKELTIPIYAHSHGNLIMSNALQAIKIVLGSAAIKGRKVFSCGSPAIYWPPEIEHFDHAFTFDYVSMFTTYPKWNISKVGWPDKTYNPWTHGFGWYLQEDAAFIINRHRIGGLGVTFNMDEKGLAQELASYGTNEARLLRVFRRLDRLHNSDVDDVACYYVDMMKQPANESRLKAMPTLIKELIRFMDEGWTTSGEKSRIEYLQGLLK